MRNLGEKTIKELADDIGVSKTAINNKVTEEMRNKYYSKIGNKFVINEDGQELIKSLFIEPAEGSVEETENSQNTADGNEADENKGGDTDQEEDSNEVTETGVVTGDQWSKTTVNIIEDYQRQLEQKDKQLTEMYRLLDQQQQLTLQTNHTKERLEGQLDEYQEKERQEQEVQQTENNNKKWWQFWKTEG